ncbi:hypothetical protein CCMA1212_004150 [Trichoderma ghanense]|uniref:HNH nuclease domain-containing protein n=1 Tax=Trichoderma ghanense TaxID=65468 RepID=A0ABY2H9L1_9HYPO
MAHTEQGQAGPPPAGTFSVHVERVTATEDTDERNTPVIRRGTYPPTVPQDGLVERINRVRTIMSGLEYHMEELSYAEAASGDDGEGECEDVCDGHETSNQQLSYLQKTLSMELAKMRQEEILLERQLLLRERAAGLTPQGKMEATLSSQIWRFTLAGGDFWRNLKERMQLEDPSAVRLRHSGEPVGIRQKLAALYKDDDGLENRKRPMYFKRDALEFYSAIPERHGRSKDEGWCHITGTWYPNPLEPANIVPFHMEANKLAELVFGAVTVSVRSSANALLLRPGFHCWLKEYKFVIVPFDRSEGAVTRWKVEVICPDKNNPRSLTDEVRGWKYGENIDGKELSFLGKNRPATKFLWFHFLMAMVRIKDLERENWREVWQRYYREEPFPAPSSYMRKAVIRALATYFSVGDMNVVESWVYRQGFENYHIQDELVKKEIARRVHLLVLEDRGNPDYKSDYSDVVWEGGYDFYD